MRTLLTRRAGQPGTKKLLMQYGRELVCVRYRYDEDRCERLKTVEIVVERVEWHPGKRAAAPEKVRVRILPGEGLLRRAALFAGARWDESTDTFIALRPPYLRSSSKALSAAGSYSAGVPLERLAGITAIPSRTYL